MIFVNLFFSLKVFITEKIIKLLYLYNTILIVYLIFIYFYFILLIILILILILIKSFIYCFTSSFTEYIFFIKILKKYIN